MICKKPIHFSDRRPWNKVSAQRTDNLMIGSISEKIAIMDAKIFSSSFHNVRTPSIKLKFTAFMSEGDRIWAIAVHSPAAGLTEKIGSIEAPPKRKHDIAINIKDLLRFIFR